MSNYLAYAKNPVTGKFETVEMMDDFYGRHQYGVRFPDGKVYKEEMITFSTAITQHIDFKW